MYIFGEQCGLVDCGVSTWASSGGSVVNRRRAKEGSIVRVR